MTEVQTVFVHGSVEGTLRRYHFEVSFPDRQYDFTDKKHKNEWGRRLPSNSYSYGRFYNILGKIVEHPWVVSVSTRQYNIAVSLKDVKSSTTQSRRWREFDQLVAQWAAEEYWERHGVGMWRDMRKQPAVVIDMREYDHPTAIGPSPQKRVAQVLPEDFESGDLSWSRWQTERGMISISDALRTSRSSLLLLKRVQRIEGVSSVHITHKSVSCDVGLAFPLARMEFALEHAVATIVQNLSRVSLPT